MLSPRSQLILQYLKDKGPCTLSQIAGVVNDPLGEIRKRLTNMRSLGYIDRGLVDGVLTHRAIPEADRVKYVKPVRAAEPAPAAPLNVVRSADYNIMGAPNWQPPKSQPYRPGAMDFIRCPSVTHGAATPFKTALEVDHG